MTVQELLALAADHLWQSTLFAAAAAIVALLLKRHSASVRYWVWFAASAKFLVPFAALIAIGGYSSWRSVDVIPYEPAPPLIETVGQPFTQQAATVPTPRQRQAESPMREWLPPALAAVWLAGALFFLIHSLREWFRVRAIARRAIELTAGREVEMLRALERAESSSTRLALKATDTFLEPGILGIVRPVLLWPRTMGERLTDQQLQAVLAHERCHLRRSDNLTALFHLSIQTVFWFHPLVWWIGARLIAERERACDEAVIRGGSEPEAYAESILKTCQFFVESPLTCVSGITGSDLKKRIEEIMTNESITTTALWKKTLLTTAGVFAFVAPVAVGALNPPPQTRALAAPATLPAFEAISVRPNVTEGRGGRGGGAFQPGRYVAQNVTLKTILRRAFGREGAGGPNTTVDLFETQIAGGPQWLDEEKFDIIATTAEATQPREMRLMVQRMLADRFKLAAHWEKRELPVYALMKARADGQLGAGLTLKSEADCAALKREGPLPMPQPGVPAPLPPCGAIQFGPGQLIASGTPMDLFVTTLTNVPVVTGIDRMVVDQTGIKGAYAFTLRFKPAGSPNADLERPELFTALREQLGLKLDATQAPIEVLVVDSVEKPTAN